MREKKVFPRVYIALVFLLIYLPVLAAVVYSFNASQYGTWSGFTLDIARKSGLMQKIDKSIVTNFKDIDPAFQGFFFDENNEYTVPYVAGTPLIVYDPAKVGFEIKGYNDLWNEALKDSLVVMDDARVMIGITLLSMGQSMNTTDPTILAQAEEKLKSLRPNIRAFNYDTPHEMMISGEASVGFMFTSQASAAIAERPDLAVCYPEEGLGFGIDAFFIPVAAPHPTAANKFLNYVLQGEVSAELSLFTQYMNCVSTAKEFLPEEFLNNPVLYIPADKIGKTEIIEDVGAEATELYNDIWTRFKQ